MQYGQKFIVRLVMHDLSLPELPGYIPSVDIQELRRQEYIDNRLPSMPGVSIEKYFMTDRQAEAAALAEAIGIAYEEDRQRAIIMRAKMRAEERIAQRYAEEGY